MATMSVEEYEAALKRIIELEDFPECSPQAEELAALIKAVADWNKAQEDTCSRLRLDWPQTD